MDDRVRVACDLLAPSDHENAFFGREKETRIDDTDAGSLEFDTSRTQLARFTVVIDHARAKFRFSDKFRRYVRKTNIPWE